jgi:hypothetical protein
VLWVTGFLLPSGSAEHSASDVATDPSGRGWNVNTSDKVTYYYGQPWSHTLAAAWTSYPMPAGVNPSPAGCRRSRDASIAAGMCPDCSYPLVPRRDAPSGCQCPERGAIYG